MTESTSRLKNAIRFLRCLLVFGFLFVLFLVLYRAIPPEMDVQINQWVNAEPATLIINCILPGQPVDAVEARLVGAHTAINVRKGCEGFEVLAMMTAAMLAYPQLWRARLAGLIAGLVFVYVLNVLRIVALFFVYRSLPAWAETAHVGVGQAVMILLVILFFMVWTERVARASTARTHPLPGP